MFSKGTHHASAIAIREVPGAGCRGRHFRLFTGHKVYIVESPMKWLLFLLWWKQPLWIYKPHPHTTILQQTTLNKFCLITENLYNWMDNLWLKVESIVAKWWTGFEQFLLLSLCFPKAVWCKGVIKCLYEGKGKLRHKHAPWGFAFYIHVICTRIWKRLHNRRCVSQTI